MALTYGTSIHLAAFLRVATRSSLEGLSELRSTFTAEFLRHQRKTAEGFISRDLRAVFASSDLAEHRVRCQV